MSDNDVPDGNAGNQFPLKKGFFRIQSPSNHRNRLELVNRLLLLPEEKMVALLLLLQPLEVKVRYKRIRAQEGENSGLNGTAYSHLSKQAKVEKIISKLSEVELDQLLERLAEVGGSAIINKG